MKIFDGCVIASIILGIGGVVTISSYPTRQEIVVDAQVTDKMIIPSKNGQLVLIYKDEYGGMGDMKVTPTSYSTLTVGDHIKVTRRVGEVSPQHPMMQWEGMMYLLSFLSMALAILMSMFWMLGRDDGDSYY